MVALNTTTSWTLYCIYAHSGILSAIAGAFNEKECPSAMAWVVNQVNWAPKGNEGASIASAISECHFE